VESPRLSGNRLQLFTWLETNCLAWRDIYLLAGARVAADTRLAGLDVEDAEAAELYPAAPAQGVLHAFKDRFYGLFGFRARYVCTGDDRVHDIELDHARLLLEKGSLC
jgi:hypothetical protein